MPRCWQSFSQPSQSIPLGAKLPSLAAQVSKSNDTLIKKLLPFSTTATQAWTGAISDHIQAIHSSGEEQVVDVFIPSPSRPGWGSPLFQTLLSLLRDEPWVYWVYWEITWESTRGLRRHMGVGRAGKQNTQDILIEEPTFMFTPRNKSEWERTKENVSPSNQLILQQQENWSWNVDGTPAHKRLQWGLWGR